MSSSRTYDLVLAVNEVVTNSLRYGGGYGDLRIWTSGSAVVCQVRDEGRIDDPLRVGGPRPPCRRAGSGCGW